MNSPIYIKRKKSSFGIVLALPNPRFDLMRFNHCHLIPQDNSPGKSALGRLKSVGNMKEAHWCLIPDMQAVGSLHILL